MIAPRRQVFGEAFPGAVSAAVAATAAACPMRETGSGRACALLFLLHCHLRAVSVRAVERLRTRARPGTPSKPPHRVPKCIRFGQCPHHRPGLLPALRRSFTHLPLRRPALLLWPAASTATRFAPVLCGCTRVRVGTHLCPPLVLAGPAVAAPFGLVAEAAAARVARLLVAMAVRSLAIVAKPPSG